MSSLYVKHVNIGVYDVKGLFANTAFRKSEVIRKLHGLVHDKPSKTTIEIDDNVHVDDEYGMYMNHSFTPNCCIQNGAIVALEDIPADTELTFDYSINETNMACPFVDNQTKQIVVGKYQWLKD